MIIFGIRFKEFLKLSNRIVENLSAINDPTIIHHGYECT